MADDSKTVMGLHKYAAEMAGEQDKAGVSLRKSGMFSRSTVTLAGLMCLIMSCKTVHSQAPEARFRALEKSLLDATDIQMEFHATAEGAIRVDMWGILQIVTGSEAAAGKGAEARILHNLARLIANVQPDHADGGAGDWVIVNSFGMDPQQDSAISFEIIVAGTPSGSAILEIGTAGQPVERHQTVRFTSGVRSYAWNA